MQFQRRWLMAAVAVGLSGSAAQAALVQPTTGTYDEQTTATNSVDTSATAAPNNAATFSTAVSTAYAADLGGVINFDLSANATDTVLSALYGTSQNKTLTITSNKTLSDQTVTSSTSISGLRVALLGANTLGAGGNDFTLTVGPITGGLTNEAVTRVGLTALSRNTTGFPGSFTLTATYSGGGTDSSTFTLSNTSGAGDTFVGFSAPAGQAISSLAFDGPDATTGQDTRLIFDDLGFVTSVVPEPSMVGLILIPTLGLLSRRRRVG